MARQRAELETWKIKLSNASRNQHSNKKMEKAKLRDTEDIQNKSQCYI